MPKLLLSGSLASGRSICVICAVGARKSCIRASHIWSVLRFMDAPLLHNHQLSSNAVYVCEREQRVHLRQVLFDPTVVNLRVPPQALDHKEPMLDRRTHSGQPPVACSLCIGQRSAFRAALIGIELKPSSPSLFLERRGVVGRVAMQALLGPVHTPEICPNAWDCLSSHRHAQKTSVQSFNDFRLSEVFNSS